MGCFRVIKNAWAVVASVWSFTSIIVIRLKIIKMTKVREMSQYNTNYVVCN